MPEESDYSAANSCNIENGTKLPTEEQQFQVYRRQQRQGTKKVVIRTADLEAKSRQNV